MRKHDGYWVVTGFFEHCIYLFLEREGGGIKRHKHQCVRDD